MKQHTTAQASSGALFVTPFSAGFWHHAASEVRRTRMLTVTALLCALCALIDMFFVPIGGAFLRVYFSFLIAGLLCTVCGPVLALPAGFLVDTLSFLFSGGDPSGYFPGYALSAMLSFLIYALFFYRTPVLSLSRIFAARLCVNVFINVILGSAWKHILYGNAYIVYFISGAIKNLAILPIEAALMLFLYRRLLPVLQRAGLVPSAVTVSVRRRDYIFSAVSALAGAAVLIAYYFYKNP